MSQEITSVLFLVLVVGLSQAQYRWYRPANFRPFHNQFPPMFQQQNIPQRNLGFGQMNPRFMGFQAPLFGQHNQNGQDATDYHASSGQQQPGTDRQDTKFNMPRPTLYPGDRKPVNQGFQAAANQENPTIRLSDTTEKMKVATPQTDACTYVVCPKGTLCSSHPGQCTNLPCPQYAACEKIKAIESCSEPLVIGGCTYNYEHFFFNSTSGKCEKFIYTGCDGNNNRFATEKQCEQVCVPSKKLCHLDKETGPCRAAKPRWYFEQASQSCKEFIFGGCKGNSNNFNTNSECMKVCGN
ncbi:hypothetical protein SNE40_008665 [Patella caerulea]|uniref:BPTI/Kunitz inhibitor domain-containing protein n=1 Tax=Patella caerulea TaxID=87958 RepID=A0AAN8PWK5_PATCE